MSVYVPRESGVCDRGEVCHLFQLVPLRGFGGLPNKRLATLPLFRRYIPPLNGSPRERSMCKERGLSPFPACPPSGVRGLTK